jgi:hypothetical protein
MWSQNWMTGTSPAVRRIETRDELIEVIRGGRGYLYNAFGGRDRSLCPIHHVDCEAVRAMMDVASGKLSVPKWWSEDVTALVREVRSHGRVFEYCQLESDLP